MLSTTSATTTTHPHPASNPDLNSDGTTNFDQVIQASQARATYGVDGTGMSVAVIDTGVNYKNPAFGSGAIGTSGSKVVAGVDFTGSPNGILPTWEHGTGVAGLIASETPSDQGVAPGAGIVALRVFNDNNQGSFASIASALDWVVANHTQYNITAVNLSISDGGNYSTNQFATDGGVGQQITTDVAKLDSINIPVVVAAGNSFDGKTQGMGFPSIISDTISVTATDETSVTSSNSKDQLASNAQRLGVTVGGNASTKIAAPGVGITAPSGTSGTVTEDGTSFATPQVTGTIVLLQQMFEKAYGTLPSVSELDSLLQAGSIPVTDSSTGLTIGRLDVLNSLQILNSEILASRSSGSSTGSGSTTAPAPVTTPTQSPSTPTGSGSSNSTSSTSGSTTTSGANQLMTSPMTNVIFNGISVGNYSTAQLATVYSRLFSFTKGPVTTFQGWGPSGSTLNLGGPKPSGSVVHAFATSSKVKVETHPIVVKHLETSKPGNDIHKAVLTTKR